MPNVEPQNAKRDERTLMTTKHESKALTHDDHWEIECLQRQFPEHSYEEILWALRTCKKERHDSVALEKCLKRKLRA
jgi:hypothetical protein